MQLEQGSGYFNVSPSSEEERLVNYIFLRTYQYWEDAVDREFSNVYAQKVLTAVADQLELDVTRGWYKFGRCGLIQPNIGIISEDLQPPEMGNTGELDTSIEETCRDYNPHKDSVYWRHKQYQDYDNEVYEHILLLETGLSETPLSAKTEEHLRGLRADFPDEGYVGEKCHDVVDAFCTLSLELLDKAETGDREKFTQIRDAFGSLTELISKAYMYDTVVGPESEEVRSRISEGIDWDREEVIDNLKTLRSEVLVIAQDIEKRTDNYKRKREEEWEEAVATADGDIRKATQIFDQQAQ